jgi:hypothetical protein
LGDLHRPRSSPALGSCVGRPGQGEIGQDLIRGAPVFLWMGFPSLGALAVILDVVVSPDQAPARLTHHITYELAPDAPLATIIGSHEIHGPEGHRSWWPGACQRDRGCCAWEPSAPICGTIGWSGAAPGPMPSHRCGSEWMRRVPPWGAIRPAWSER